ncbi:response regulator transcription factor [Lentzea sp. NPDC059081]|uniref:response regulator transcription factor n=1 Tax=Lentzea sp. NPDC059081 TaxID=3346719 RepID=UPI003697819B
MATAKILVVEDTPEISYVIELALADARFEVRVAACGQEGLRAARQWAPDVVILDLNLPDLDGFEVCRRLREFTTAYVVMLTGRADEVDKLVGLTSGADDYMTKPFSPRELTARVQVMLRRPRGGGPAAPAVPHQRRTLGSVEVDLDTREVTVRGEPVSMTRIEFELLAALSENPRQIRTRDQLRARAWGEAWRADDHAVDVHLSNLRRKLATAGAPNLISTVRGVGYRMNWKNL